MASEARTILLTPQRGRFARFLLRPVRSARGGSVASVATVASDGSVATCVTTAPGVGLAVADLIDATRAGHAASRDDEAARRLELVSAEAPRVAAPRWTRRRRGTATRDRYVAASGARRPDQA
jgi:hypothetical protein